MFVYNIDTGTRLDHAPTAPPAAGEHYFIHCSSAEMEGIEDVFDFAPDTLADCTNFDENTRLTSFPGYDFTSLVYFSMQDGAAVFSEVNIYAGERFIVLVTQEGDEHVRDIRERIVSHVGNLPHAHGMNRVYYFIFDVLLTSMSESLEKLEDGLNAVEKTLVGNVDESHFASVAAARESVYRVRKHLRPLLYVGDQLLVDENNLISEENLRFFRNVDQRINKIFDFSQSLQEYANRLSNQYDSRLTARTNDVVNKLTIITLFLSPLTVISGIYGMNFTHMPELEWYYGYPLALGLMALVSAISFIVLKLKKWL